MPDRSTSPISLYNASPVKRPRILYIHPGNVPPQLPPARNACFHLSKWMDGDLVAASWDSTRDYTANREKYESALGAFGYAPVMGHAWPRLLRPAAEFLMYCNRCLQLSRTHHYDAIVAYGLFRTAWVGLVVKMMRGTPLILQVAGNPWKAFAGDRSVWGWLKRKLVRPVVSVAIRNADHLHLLYEEQRRLFDGRRTPGWSAFPDFAATSLVRGASSDGGYILFLGFPWKLKGVDVLIASFNKICSAHPESRLKIVGHCPDRTEFEILAKGNPRIEFCEAVLHHEAMELIGNCSFLVLPSRTEGIPRVILEAWAANKAVVASDVDGIPFLIRDRVDGLLFPSEDVDALARCLSSLLVNPETRAQLAKNGNERIRSDLNESSYAKGFYQMIVSVSSGRSRFDAR